MSWIKQQINYTKSSSQSSEWRGVEGYISRDSAVYRFRVDAF